MPATRLTPPWLPWMVASMLVGGGGGGGPLGICLKLFVSSGTGSKGSPSSSSSIFSPPSGSFRPKSSSSWCWSRSDSVMMGGRSSPPRWIISYNSVVMVIVVMCFSYIIFCISIWLFYMFPYILLIHMDLCGRVSGNAFLLVSKASHAHPAAEVQRLTRYYCCLFCLYTGEWFEHFNMCICFYLLSLQVLEFMKIVHWVKHYTPSVR